MTARDDLLVFTPTGIASCWEMRRHELGEFPCPAAPAAVILGRTYCAEHGSRWFARYVALSFQEALAHRFGPADPLVGGDAFPVEGVPV